MKCGRMIRFCTLIVAVSLLISGCSLAGKKVDLGERNVSDAGKKYFHEVWRADLKYFDIEYKRYESAQFDHYAEVVRRFASEGRTVVSFADAYYDLWNELQYVYTMMTLAELEVMADPEDEELSFEYLYTAETYDLLYERYWEIMHEVAVSPYSDVMKEIFHESYIEWFKEYVPYTNEEWELLAYTEEKQLTREYYDLLKEEEPDEGRIGEIFVELVNLRKRQAELFGYEGYAEYAYGAIYGRDYLPQDTEAVWQGVKEAIVPVYVANREAANLQAELLQEAELDCSTEAVLGALERVLPNVSSDLNYAFEYMEKYGLYDIDFDPKKSNTGYTVRLYYYNQPFVFNAGTDEFYDYLTVIHEFGHFANAFYTESDLLFGLSDNDICELQSQGLEVLMTHYYDVIFGEEYAEAAREYLLMDMLVSVIDGALFDEFLRTVYAEDKLTPERADEIYGQLYLEYGYEPYEGYEREWMWVTHNFEMPFYYISYALSALSALELYELSCESLADGVDKYLAICAADTEMYYFTEFLKEHGLSDVLDPSVYAGLAENVAKSFE